MRPRHDILLLMQVLSKEAKNEPGGQASHLAVGASESALEPSVGSLLQVWLGALASLSSGETLSSCSGTAAAICSGTSCSMAKRKAIVQQTTNRLESGLRTDSDRQHN